MKMNMSKCVAISCWFLAGGVCGAIVDRCMCSCGSHVSESVGVSGFEHGRGAQARSPWFEHAERHFAFDRFDSGSASVSSFGAQQFTGERGFEKFDPTARFERPHGFDFTFQLQPFASNDGSNYHGAGHDFVHHDSNRNRNHFDVV